MTATLAPAAPQPTLTPANAARVVKKYGGIVVEPVSSPDRGVAIGIYGPGGVGKTTLAATVTDTPLGAPGLILDARGNPHVVSSYADRLDVLPITKFAQIEAVRQSIIADRDRPKSVILDNVSEMWSIDLRDLYGPVMDVDWTKHSASTADVIQLVRNWMDLTYPPYCMNVIFVFQETPESRTIRNQKVESRSEIAFNKALQSHLPTLVNFLGRLYIASDTPPYPRVLDFTPVETMHQAKLQIDRNDPISKDVPYIHYNPSLASLVDTIRGRQPWPTARHSKDGK